MTQQQADLDKEQYLGGLEDFVLLCDLWGARKVLEDMQYFYPETFQQLKYSITSMVELKKVAALLRK